MSTGVRSNATTVVVAALTALLVAGAPAVARSAATFARTGIDASTVRGFGAVGCHASRANRSGKLVATCADTGRLPNNIIAKAPDASRLDGKNASAFLGVGEKAADSDLLDGQDSTAFLGAGGKAADSDLLDGQDSTAFLGAGGKAADADLLDGQDSTAFLPAGGTAANADALDGIDSLGFARSTIYVRTMVTNGSANVQGTCPSGDLCYAGGYYCDNGDTLTGGGFAEIDNGTRLVASEPFVPNPQDAWRVIFVNNATEDTITVYTICADNGTPHS
jgi:hypothetical protein